MNALCMYDPRQIYVRTFLLDTARRPCQVIQDDLGAKSANTARRPCQVIQNDLEAKSVSWVVDCVAVWLCGYLNCQPSFHVFLVMESTSVWSLFFGNSHSNVELRHLVDASFRVFLNCTFDLGCVST